MEVLSVEYEFSVLGKNVPRKDALEKVNGDIRFVSDIQLPRMLHTAFLRSPWAHARVTKIDATEAEALPGVKCVLTHKNTPKLRPGKKFEFLLDDTVHQAGEEVAVVAAETKEIAEEALRLIAVEYEALPAVFDAENAMKANAPLVHPEYGTNIYRGSKVNHVPKIRPDGWLPIELGNVDTGFAEADIIVENTYESPMQYNLSPLTRSVICQWIGDELNCWAETQSPVFVAKDLARSLSMPLSRIRVIANPTVGSYGGKNPEKIAILTALIARKTKRPVCAVFTRQEDFIATHHRPSFKVYGKLGVQRDGTITTAYYKIIGNFGHDLHAPIEIISAAGASTCSTLYPCPNLKFEGCVVLTNIPTAGPMCGFGDPEVGFCVERLIDEAAEKIGMDPVEFRLKNCARYGTRSATRRDIMGLSYDELRTLPGPINWGIVGPDFDSLPEAIQKVASEAQWEKKWKGWKKPVEVHGPIKTGIGIALGMHMSEYRVYSAIIKMNQDGTANVLSSAVEIGQGIKTAMAQVVAETIGIQLEDVNVTLADTAATPEGWGIFASGGTSSAIPAAWHAANDVKQKLFSIAAKSLGVNPNQLKAKDRRIFVDEKPEIGISITEACLLGYQVTGEAVNPSADSIIDEKTGKIIKSYACTAVIAEVTVDTETGALDVVRLTTANECGRAINPKIVENQINLGITLGNGLARTEEYIIDPHTGVVLNCNLLDYKIMTILDMPKGDNVQEIIIENPCAWGAFGAKGFSETASTAVAPAIANAIYNAIGKRIRGAHLAPQRILDALGK